MRAVHDDEAEVAWYCLTRAMTSCSSALLSGGGGLQVGGFFRGKLSGSWLLAGCGSLEVCLLVGGPRPRWSPNNAESCTSVRGRGASSAAEIDAEGGAGVEG